MVHAVSFARSFLHGAVSPACRLQGEAWLLMRLAARGRQARRFSEEEWNRAMESFQAASLQRARAVA